MNLSKEKERASFSIGATWLEEPSSSAEIINEDGSRVIISPGDRVLVVSGFVSKTQELTVIEPVYKEGTMPGGYTGWYLAAIRFENENGEEKRISRGSIKRISHV